MKKICIAVLGMAVSLGAFGAPALVDATDCGIKADGVSDDGPAIRAMLEQAAQIEGPVELRFPENGVIAVKTGTERYVFNLHSQTNLTINGCGAEFRLDPSLRFLDAFNCERLVYARI